MKKNAGLVALLLIACLITFCLNDRFLAPVNIENLLRRTALFSLISIAVSFVIAVGGIDLSIGSVVCLVGTILPWLTTVQLWPFPIACASLLLVVTAVGVCHGLLVTRLSLQPFIVTLCGLLLYRGIARGITSDQTQGFGLEYENIRNIVFHRVTLGGFLPLGIPNAVFLTILVAIVAALVMNKTRFGLYVRAVGQNEVGARYSGINTQRIIILAYTTCSVLAAVAGVMFILDVNSAQPSDFGNFYELYAIAAAVLGGCSLRGGEWNMTGIIIGASLMQVLRNAIVLLDIPTQLEFAIIGGVIMVGVVGEHITTSAVKKRA